MTSIDLVVVVVDLVIQYPGVVNMAMLFANDNTVYALIGMKK